MKHRGLFPAVVLAGALLVAPGTPVAPVNAATAYTVEPLNFNWVESTPKLFNGAVCAVYQCVKVPTAAALDLSHRRGVFGENGPIADGARNLNTLLVADAGEKLVFGYSQGAQVSGFWLRNYAPTTSVDRANTSFLLVGDPENTYGVPWAPKVPTDTGFAVTEVWAQYDGWADWPTRFDLLAIANAVYGMLFVHPRVYDHLDLAAQEAAGNVVTWQADGVTYKMVADRTLPILDPLRNIGFGWVADLVNDTWRAHIEAQYDRPRTQDEADARYPVSTATIQDEDEPEAPPERDVEQPTEPEVRTVTRAERRAELVRATEDADEPVATLDTDADGGSAGPAPEPEPETTTGPELPAAQQDPQEQTAEASAPDAQAATAEPSKQAED